MARASRDKDGDGIDDAFAAGLKKGVLVGAIAGVFGGGIILSLVVYFVPQASGLLAIFAGGACRQVEQSLAECQIEKARLEGPVQVKE